jgi:hypothetical protein
MSEYDHPGVSRELPAQERKRFLQELNAGLVRWLRSHWILVAVGLVHQRPDGAIAGEEAEILAELCAVRADTDYDED